MTHTNRRPVLVDMFGRMRPRHRRVVPKPEAMDDANREQFAHALWLALKCAKVIDSGLLRVGPFIAVHGDGLIWK